MDSDIQLASKSAALPIVDFSFSSSSLHLNINHFTKKTSSCFLRFLLQGNKLFRGPIMIRHDRVLPRVARCCIKGFLESVDLQRYLPYIADYRGHFHVKLRLDDETEICLAR